MVMANGRFVIAVVRVSWGEGFEEGNSEGCSSLLIVETELVGLAKE